MIKMTTRLLALAVLLSLPQLALAQSPPPDAPAAASAQSDQLLKPAQLDALVSPIALYPDTLLAEVLMASTYPLEVVEADRWANANKNLTGDALKAAVDKQSWDASVKSLVATPSVLDMMSNQLDWTQSLGNAVLAQQADVMDAIQRLRQKAQANNTLVSTPQQTVSTQPQETGGPPAIVITPTNPDTIYVPYYDPNVVYGGWPYPDYPPYYWPAPGYIAAGIIATGIAFGAGYAFGRWVSGGYRWGGGFNWRGNNITVNRSVNVNNVNANVNNWTHNPAHRQGVRYTNAAVAQKFGGNRNVGGGSQTGLDFRGRNGQQVLQPGAGAGNRTNNLTPGNRPAVNNRPAGNALGNAGAGNRTHQDFNRGRQNLGATNVNRGANVNRAANVNRGANVNRAANVNRGANVNRAAHVSHGGGNRAAAVSRGGGGRGGGGGHGGGRGGGRRSDIRLKHDIAYLGRLDNGIGFYRFAYVGEHKAYVGVMAQEVAAVVPDAVTRGRDGYLRVDYGKLGLTFETYKEWIASGARIPVTTRNAP